MIETKNNSIQRGYFLDGFDYHQIWPSKRKPTVCLSDVQRQVRWLGKEDDH